MILPEEAIGALQGISLGISISESEAAWKHGFTSREVNRSVREISRAILAQGGRVAFGHDWRDDGVMSEVLQIAIEYKASERVPEASTAPMTNLVPWPRRSTVSDEDRERYRGVLEIVEMRPLNPSDEDAKGASRLVREAENLSHMRAVLTERINARICIGGRTSGSSGRCAGIVEEAALSLAAGQPLFITRLFNGASSQVIAALEGIQIAELEAFHPRADIAEAFGVQGAFGDNGTDVTTIFAEALRRGLSGLNPLSEDENRALFDAGNLSEVIGLTLAGLGRFVRARRG